MSLIRNADEHLSVCHLHMFLGEECTYIFFPFFHRVTCLLLLSGRTLYVLDIHHTFVSGVVSTPASGKLGLGLCELDAPFIHSPGFTFSLRHSWNLVTSNTGCLEMMWSYGDMYGVVHVHASIVETTLCF